MTRLNTEIIRGNVPDLFVADELPIEQYGSKGLLCDLYEFIDSDEELSRDDFFENILTATMLKQILDLVYMEKVREDEGGTYGVQTSAQISSFPEGQTFLQA